MRIHYSMAGVSRTGGVRVLFEIGDRLAARGHEVTFGTCDAARHAEWFPFRHGARLEAYERTAAVRAGRGLLTRLARATGWDYRSMLDTRVLASRAPDCDVHVATFWSTAYAVAASRAGAPCYHIQHYEPAFEADRLRRLLARRTYRLPLRQFVNSEWCQRRIHEQVGRKPPIVNPGLDHDVFYPRPEAREGRPPSRRTVLCFGKAVEWKGFADATAALLKLQRQRDDIELVVYGAERLPVPAGLRVRWAERPSDDELARLYSGADVVLCPSWFESFPLPPLEAMACGTPVVTTRPGTEDYARHEDNALVVEPRDVDAMAAAVSRLLDDPGLAAELAARGVKTARTYTWERATDQVEELFHEAARAGPIATRRKETP